MTVDDVRSRLPLIEDEYVRTCISRGIDVLTDRFGQSWPDNVNTDRIDMSNTCDCIIGQAFECLGFQAYNMALTSLGIANESAYLFGFDVRFGFVMKNYFDYDDLDEAWRTVLSADH